jgi:hypothetical protein
MDDARRLGAVVHSIDKRPGYVAATLAAAGASVVAWLIVALVAWPLLLVASTAAVMGPSPTGALATLSFAAIALLLAQPLVSAAVFKLALSAIADAEVSYGVAVVAMMVSIAVTIAAALTLPAALSLPILGFSWSGALAAGWLVAR